MPSWLVSAAMPVPSWAAAICNAVLDPTRAARHAAASSGPDRLPSAQSDILPALRRGTAIVNNASLMSDYTLLGRSLPELIGRAELACIQADGQHASIESVVSDLYAVAGWALIKADSTAAGWVAGAAGGARCRGRPEFSSCSCRDAMSGRGSYAGR